MAHSQEALSIRQISPLHVHHLWHWIRPEIEKLLQRHPDDFRAEDVYLSLRRPGEPGGSSCFLIFREQEFKGFCIVEVAVDPFGGRRTLCVWILCFKGADECQDAIYEWLDRLKASANCSRIHMKSPRLGWFKKGGGFKLKMITWERA